VIGKISHKKVRPRGASLQPARPSLAPTWDCAKPGNLKLPWTALIDQNRTEVGPTQAGIITELSDSRFA